MRHQWHNSRYHYRAAEDQYYSVCTPPPLAADALTESIPRSRSDATATGTERSARAPNAMTLPWQRGRTFLAPCAGACARARVA